MIHGERKKEKNRTSFAQSSPPHHPSSSPSNSYLSLPLKWSSSIMLLPRILRPVLAHRAPLSIPLRRTVVPIPTRCLSTTTTESGEQPNSSEPIPPSSSPESTAFSATETQPQDRTPLPYFVGRNSLKNLSVYHKSKRGGNLELTVVKGGEGDLLALKRDIKESLKLNDGDVTVNSVTRHIIIRVCSYFPGASSQSSCTNRLASD
ncbi:hypothetical protein F5Y05DRAFT_381883 [Hypoxylon sp. FL0543]|nr:hypothetical protein F5Y05DRAFT_381883 [Hypoxylon sp. FL0543]